MKHRAYRRLVRASSNVTEIAFEPVHFQEVGLPWMSFGMPHLEALELMNKWNTGNERYVYWLA